MKKYYDIVKNIIKNDDAIPVSVKNLASSFPYIFNGIEYPIIVDVIITDDYMSCLKIDAESTNSFSGGFGWAKILRRRYNAFFPYINKTILSVSLTYSNVYASLYIDPEMPRLIECETYDIKNAPE